MGSKPISITLPSEMLADVDRTSKTEHRTRSELIREALRHYLYIRRIPLAEPTPEELVAMEKGEGEVARGEYVTLDQLKRDVGITDRQKGATKRRAVSS